MRLFVALDLGEDIRAALGRAIERARPHAPDARWVDPAKLHLTLVFLGQLDDQRTGEVVDALTRTGSRHHRFSLAVRGAGTFGARKHPRVLWTDVGGDLEELSALQADVSGELSGVGHVPEKRPYAAHVTLARARDPKGDPALATCLASLKEKDFGVVTVREVVLYRSELSPKGARYTRVDGAPLLGT